MKIGIITHHNNHNYGATLQAWALSNSINKLTNSNTAEFINYYLPELRGFSHPASHLLYKHYSEKEKLKNEFNDLREKFINEIEERYRLFELFYKENMIFSKPYNNWSELLSNPPKYDIYITGGDNMLDTVKWVFDSVQYPHLFAFTNNPNKIAYGTGMYSGLMDYNIEFKTLVLLRQYRKIMLREENGANILKKYLNNPIDVVIDSSLLPDVSDYLSLIKKPFYDIRESYIFIYSIASNTNDVNEQTIMEISKKYKKKIILVNSSIPINNEYVTTLIDTGPSEWLCLIKNADVVITNSFHGAAFSILFNRPFIVIGKDLRKITLLNTLKLSEYNVNTIDEMLYKFNDINVNFTLPNEILDNERIRCKNLLTEAIEMCR